MTNLNVCSYHVTHAFQSESTLYSCLNVKELLAWNWYKIWNLSDCSWTQIQVCDMIRKYSNMHSTNKYSQHSSIIWPVWLNGWMFVYELSGCGFESSCSHLKLPRQQHSQSMKTGKVVFGLFWATVESMNYRLFSFLLHCMDAK